MGDKGAIKQPPNNNYKNVCNGFNVIASSISAQFKPVFMTTCESTFLNHPSFSRQLFCDLPPCPARTHTHIPHPHTPHTHPLTDRDRLADQHRAEKEAALVEAQRDREALTAKWAADKDAAVRAVAVEKEQTLRQLIGEHDAATAALRQDHDRLVVALRLERDRVLAERDSGVLVAAAAAGLSQRGEKITAPLEKLLFFRQIYSFICSSAKFCKHFQPTNQIPPNSLAIFSNRESAIHSKV